jgi:energy-coupling factor transporter ATP-binding protein EcfA2
VKLKRLRLRNFRCYKDEISLTFEDITALIGKNDSGKSTILDALDIFLNDNKPDNEDASKNGNAKDLTIICEFSDFPDAMIIDDTSPTSLSQEYLLNDDGILEIHKTFNGKLQNPKCTSISIAAKHPNAPDIADLLQLKNKELKDRAKSLGIDLTNINQTINAELRSALRNSKTDLQLLTRLIPINDEDANKPWEGIKNYIPTYALFKSDRSSSDQDPEAQDPLNSAIKEAVKAKEKELDIIYKYVETEVKKIADATLEKLREMDPTLANQLTPKFKPTKWESLFKASITGDKDIPINKRGSGVKRLILLNFFRAKAEKQMKEKDKSDIIYGIEEPETSQHPNNQRMLLRALTDLSNDAQIIVSTHTPMLARALPNGNLRYINIKTDKSREILVGGQAENKIFTKALGVLPDNSVKVFIGVEGKNDIAFLLNMSKILIDAGLDIPNLLEMEINGELIFFPLGGSNLALWTSRLENLNRPEFHLFDRDNQPPLQAKYQTAVDDINRRNNCVALSTNKKEMENYIHKDAIIASYSSNRITITINANYGDFDNVPLEISKIVHSVSGSKITWDELSDEKKKEKESNSKKILNNIACSLMTKAMLDEIDPNSEVIGWFNSIKQLIENVV